MDNLILSVISSKQITMIVNGLLGASLNSYIHRQKIATLSGSSFYIITRDRSIKTPFYLYLANMVGKHCHNTQFVLSLDISPPDYNLFQKLKEPLRGSLFQQFDGT